MSTRRLFARASDAEADADRLARSHSLSAQRIRVAYTRAVQSAEGTGPAYVVRSAAGGLSDDYEIFEVELAELREMVRQGMLAAAYKAEIAEEEAAAHVAGLVRQRASEKSIAAARERRSAHRALAARLRVEAAGMQVVSVAISEAEREQGAAE